jgi:hypothetical protein
MDFVNIKADIQKAKELGRCPEIIGRTGTTCHPSPMIDLNH